MHLPKPSPLSRLTVCASLAVFLLAGPGCSGGNRSAHALDQAHRYFDAGELEKAEIEYKNVLQKDPQNVDAIARLGLLYHAQGRETRAAAYLLKAVELQPDNVAVRIKLGLAHLTAGGHKEARDEALFILERRPSEEQAPLLLVEASTTPKDLEDARQRLLALPPPAAKSAPVLVALGNVALRQNRVKDAEALFQEALAADPKSAAVHSALGVLHWSRKDLAAADAAFKQAAELVPARSPKRLHYAQFKLQTGDSASAKRILEELTRGAPDFVPGWVWLAEIANSEKKYDDADAFVAKALAREPLQPDALLLNARIRLAKKEPEKAVTELERLFSMFPRSAQIAYQLGLAHAAAGDTTRALASLAQAIAIAPEMTEASISSAELHLRKRDFPAAIATLRPILQQRPDHIGARVLLAEAYRGRNDFDGALALYTELQRQLPRDGQVAFARGTVLLQQNKFAEARAEFTKAREFMPDHLGALEQLAELDLRDKQPAVARKRVEDELAKRPDSPQLALLLAKICLSQRDTAGAEAALKKAVELQPTSSLALQQLAQFYIATQQQEKAIANLTEAARQSPKNIASHLLLGVLLDERRDHAGARDAYEKALALDAQNSLALNNLAYLYSEKFDQLDKALEMAQRARTLLPDEPRTADTLGWILARKKQYVAALSILQDSAAKLPNEPEVQYHLGVTQYMLGNETAALAALQRAIQLNATFPGVDDARKRIAILEVDAAKPEARTLLEKRLDEHPDDPIAQLRIADLLRRNGDNEKALAHYNAVLQTHPKHAGALINIAHIHAAKNEFSKAFEAAKAARNAAPNDLTITHTVGRLAYETGDHRWAASLLQELAKQRPEDTDVLHDWALAAYSIGRVPDAELSMRRVLELNRTSPRAASAQRFLDMLSLCANPAQAAVAAAKVEQTLKTDPSCAPALMAHALIQEQKSDAAAARDAYEKVLARFPEFSPAQKNLTLLYAANPADTSKAASLATKAREAFPNDLELTRAVGIIAFRQGEFARAANLLQQSAAKLTNDGELLYYLGMAQCRLNKRSEGKRSLQRALELGLKEPLALEAKKNLESSE